MMQLSQLMCDRSKAFEVQSLSQCQVPCRLRYGAYYLPLFLFSRKPRSPNLACLAGLLMSFRNPFYYHNTVATHAVGVIAYDYGALGELFSPLRFGQDETMERDARDMQLWTWLIRASSPTRYRDSIARCGPQEYITLSHCGFAFKHRMRTSLYATFQSSAQRRGI